MFHGLGVNGDSRAMVCESLHKRDMRGQRGGIDLKSSSGSWDIQSEQMTANESIKKTL